MDFVCLWRSSLISTLPILFLFIVNVCSNVLEMKAAQSALYMKELSKKSADEQEGACSIWVSFVEIYNEYIYDLLQPITLNRPKLTLAEDQNSDVYVKGLYPPCISIGILKEILSLIWFYENPSIIVALQRFGTK